MSHKKKPGPGRFMEIERRMRILKDAGFNTTGLEQCIAKKNMEAAIANIQNWRTQFEQAGFLSYFSTLKDPQRIAAAAFLDATEKYKNIQ